MTRNASPSFRDRLRAAGSASGLVRGLFSYVAELRKAFGDGERAVAVDTAHVLPPGPEYDQDRRIGTRMAHHLGGMAAGMDRPVGQPNAREITTAMDAASLDIDQIYRRWAEARNPERTMRALAASDPYAQYRLKTLDVGRTR